MQQTKSYWLAAAVAGVVSALVGSACTVTTSTDDAFGGDGGTGATNAGTGGTSSGGTTSTGGTAGSSGSTAIAGTGGVPATGGTGGTGGATIGCDMGEAGAMTGTPAANCNAIAGDACSACLQSKCCTETEVCNGTGPNNQCAFGGPDGKGEFACMRACMKKAFTDNGVGTDEDLGTCANNCGTDACGPVIGVSTSILVACVRPESGTGCNSECFEK